MVSLPLPLLDALREAGACCAMFSVRLRSALLPVVVLSGGGPLSFHTSCLMPQVVRLLSATKPLSHRGGLEGSGFYDNTV